MRVHAQTMRWWDRRVGIVFWVNHDLDCDCAVYFVAVEILLWKWSVTIGRYVNWWKVQRLWGGDR